MSRERNAERAQRLDKPELIRKSRYGVELKHRAGVRGAGEYRKGKEIQSTGHERTTPTMNLYPPADEITGWFSAIYNRANHAL